MSDKNEIKQIWDIGLSDAEIHYIGEIVAHWGAIEHEIFNQTLSSFDEPLQENIQLPKAMNNLSFTGVLKLWKERVVEISKEERKTVLNEQHKKIVHLKDYRNSLVHGMWDWKPDAPEVLITTRIRKKEIISTKFNPGDLEHFYTELAQINLLIRYPGGAEELLQEKMTQGCYINQAAIRRFRFNDKD